MKLKLSFLLILGLVLVPAALLGQNPPPASAPDKAVYISDLQGSVFFQNFEKAGLHMTLKQGDELNTENGMVEVDLGDGNWVRLGPKTRVVFTDLEKDPITLSVWQGSVYLQLNDQAVNVRCPQEERSFEKAGLYRVDVEKNKTVVYEDPRVVDRFDSWSRRREEETSIQEYRTDRWGGYPYYPYDSAYPYGGWMGWNWSPWWPGSGLSFYAGWYPLWYRYNPFYWSSYFWPSWYFGMNPYWYWDSWYYGYYPYYNYYGYGYNGRYASPNYSRYGSRVVRRDQLQQPSRAIRNPGQTTRSTSRTAIRRGTVYPSRIASPGRFTSSVPRVQRYTPSSRSYSPRVTAPRTYSSPSFRSFSAPSMSRAPSSAGRSSGGARRR